MRLIWKLLGPRVPRVELSRFKRIDFFPPYPAPLEGAEAICLGTKSRSIGDTLMLSTLPAKLRARYPGLKVDVYHRGFNPVVFANHPAVDGVSYLPERLYGDDCDLDGGHLIQLKERFFGLELSRSPTPEVHLHPREKAWIARYLERSTRRPDLPLCVIHPWGKTHTEVLTASLWESRVRAWSGKFRFWQVGLRGQVAIAGCEHHLLLPPAFHEARKLFALMSRADLFVGVDSGPMHAARAFGVPALILTDYGIPFEEIFRTRQEQPHYRTRRACGFLYEQNAHHDVTFGAPQPAIDEFLESRSKKTPTSTL